MEFKTSVEGCIMKKQLAKLLKAYHKKWDCFGNKRRKK